MSAMIEIKHLYKTYSRKRWLWGEGEALPVLKDVSLSIAPNRVMGLVGESGCGKSTLCKVLLGIEKPTSGTVCINGQETTDLSKAAWKELRRVMQVVYQDPYSSLDPRMTVRQQLAEALDIHGLKKEPAARENFLKALLSSVGLAAECLNRYPHEFSGGQRQRICIARTLVLDPKIIIADEPVSALDVSVQAQILNLLQDIRRERRLSMLFVTHDFSVARFLCDDIAVMYKGSLVELAPAQELVEHPLHPYTQTLLAAVPEVGRRKLMQVSSLNTDSKTGSFLLTEKAVPPLREISPGHWCTVGRTQERNLQ